MGGFATPNGSLFFFFSNFCTLVVMLSEKETQGRGGFTDSLTNFHICKYMATSTTCTDMVWWWWEVSLSTKQQRLRHGGRRGIGVCVSVCAGGGVAG